jgi:hypothetical protein
LAGAVLATGLLVLLGAGGKVADPNCVAPDRYVYYPGTWGPAFNAQNPMLDEHMKRYKLQDQDWRKQRPWYEPSQ